MWKYMFLKTLLFQFLIIVFFDSTGSTNLPSFPKDFNISDDLLSDLADRTSQQYAVKYLTFLKTGEESSDLWELNRKLLSQRSNESWAHGLRNVNAADKFLACATCRSIVYAAEQLIRDPAGEWIGTDKEHYVQRIFMNICQYFKILKQDVCHGIFTAYWPIFEYMLRNGRIDGRIFCNRLGINFCNVKQPASNWVFAINDGVRVVKPFKAEKPWDGSSVHVLQISDIHYDPEYKAGALADCDEPLCCHQMPAVGSVESKKLAGYWGDNRVCDAPLRMIENAFNHMRRTHQNTKYIYYTGDILPHTVWKTTRAEVMEILTHMDKLMREKFPDVPIYPCVGNNDVYPIDLSSPTDVPEHINTKWLNTRLYWLWSKNLPQDTKDTILKGGYYTVSPHVGFRIISLNTNECRLNNFWLYFNNTFAIEQLHWLHDTLLLAEQAQEFVHILAHTPISSAECWKPWSQEYFRLIERFQHIITGIFYGHTHTNDISLHYDNKGNAVSVAWHGGSLTSFIGRNPSYRVYEAEPRTMKIVDNEIWTFNLTAANLYGSSQNPQWYRLSHFTENFTNDLSPNGIDALFKRMSSNPDLLRKYWLSKTTASDSMLAQGCNKNCLQKTLCGSVGQQARCLDLKARLEQSLLLEAAASSDAALKRIIQIWVFFFSSLCILELFYG